MTDLIPGHLYGPPAPHIAFFFGNHYLGETRGHHTDIQSAMEKLARSNEILHPAHFGKLNAMLRMADRIMLYCGGFAMPVRDLLAKSAPERRLAGKLAYYGFTANPSISKQAYVLTIILSDDGTYAIGLLKNRGPEKLIGKITFPGGRIDAGETPRQAASRELFEETGVTVPESDLVNILNSQAVAVFAARSSDVLKAMTREDEQVMVLAIPRHLEYCKRNPKAYIDEFSLFLASAENALQQ